MKLARTRRAFHHAVMPVQSLVSARTFFEALGFLVAPDAAHPFGTANACIFLADGSYLEPLAVGDPALCAAEAKRGNVFLRRDEAFRKARAVPGFSGIAFASEDAAADHAAFRREGIAEGDRLEFSRSFRAPGSGQGTLTFRLAFAADRRSPTLVFFACEAVGASTPDRSALTAHPNGAAGVARLVLSAPVPEDYLDLMERIVGPRRGAAASGLSFAAGMTMIELLAPADLLARYGRNPSGAEGLVFEGIVISVPTLARIRDRARQKGITISESGERLVVPLGEGDAGFIAFEASA